MIARWRRAGIRARTTAAAAALLAATLVVGTVALAALFAAGRFRDLDAQTRTEAATLVALVAGGQLPPVLPAPAGSPLFAQVLAGDGTVLAASASASRVLPLVEGGAGDRVDTDEEGAYAGVPLRVRTRAAALSGRPVRVVVAAPLGDVRAAVRSLRVVLVLVVPLLVLGGTGLTWWATGLALRPVERLRQAAVGLARDGTGTLPPVVGSDEVALLSRTLSDLVASLQTSLARQRAFVADAAHELRSPLASARVQLDVAAAHPSSVDVPELVADLTVDLGRLQALAEDLLLARAEVRGPLDHGPVDLAALAGSEGPPVLVAGDAAALRRVVDNLVGNARAHADQVQVAVHRDGPWAVLDVDDDGPGIPPADRQRVFDRWVRLDAARARADGGAGLGLALVREVADAHGGQVEVLDSPLGGARLRLRLPAAL